jgi:DNA polymerase-3 subunit beta
MKLSVPRKKFTTVFQAAATFAVPRSTKPIFQNVLIDATGDDVLLFGTDAEVSAIVQAGDDIEVQRGGKAILSLQHVSAILKESREETLTIESTDRGIAIKGERTSFKLPSIDADEFPPGKQFNAEKYHIIPAIALCEMIERTEFACDLDSSRYTLGGILFHFEADKLVMVATDGRRMAKAESPAESVNNAEYDSRLIVRLEAMRLIRRVLSDAAGNVKIALDNNDMIFASDAITIAARLLEGGFPRWKDAIPKRRSCTTVSFEAGELLSLVRQSAIVLGNESMAVAFTFSDGELTLSATGAETGVSDVSMPIAYRGETIKTILDHRFVSDFLKAFSGDTEIEFEIEDGESAAVLRAFDHAAEYVVMPLGIK